MTRVVLHAVFLTLLVLVLNVNLRTMLRQEDAIWREQLQLHQQSPPFSLRPLTSFTVDYLSSRCGLTLRDAFLISQYPVLLALLISFVAYLRQLQFSQRQTLAGLWMLTFTFPILCVHFVPNWTWDDLWAYVTLIWMAVFLWRGRPLLAGACLALAALSRESVLLALPAFFLFSPRGARSGRWLFGAMLPLLVYLVYRLICFPDVLSGRLTRLPVNFADAGATRQSLYSLFVSFGWLWVAAAIAVGRVRRAAKGASDKRWHSLANSAWVVALLTVAVTMTAALLRETRLLFTPFIFIVPLALKELVSLRGIAVKVVGSVPIWLPVPAMLLLLGGCIGLAVVLFPSFPYLPMIDFHRVYFAVHLAASAVVAGLVGYGGGFGAPAASSDAIEAE